MICLSVTETAEVNSSFFFFSFIVHYMPILTFKLLINCNWTKTETDVTTFASKTVFSLVLVVWYFHVKAFISLCAFQLIK